MHKTKRNNLFVFIGLIILAFFISSIPIIHLPFSWIQTYFHEISHGLAALLTGGAVQSIEIHFRGSGLCTTYGGIRFFVVFAGYIGAVIWGALIYMMVDNVSKKNAMTIASIGMVMVGLSGLFWARDLVTIIIMGAILIPFLIVLKTRSEALVRYFLQFLGLYVLLDAIKSPLVLLGIRNYGDANTLSELTGLPEIIWVLMWFCCGLYALYFLWKGHLKRSPDIA